MMRWEEERKTRRGDEDCEMRMREGHDERSGGEEEDEKRRR